MDRRNIAAKYAADSFKESLALLRELGRIPSPSHNEDRRAEFCRDWLKSHGAEGVYIDAAKNVVCPIGVTEGDPIVVFEAHTDVVFPDTDPLPLSEDDEKIYAPGIGDDTANLVNLLMATKYLLANPQKPPVGILIVANSCEEGLGNLDGTKEIFKNYGPRIRGFYSFDGGMPMCCTGAVGSYRWKVSCHTPGGHSYGNFGRPNAIAVLAKLINKLYSLELPAEGKTTFNVGRIEGGTTVNSIAQDASMLFEFRSPQQCNLETMEQKFNAAIDECREPNVEISVELLGVRPGNGPINYAELDVFTARAADIIKAHTGLDPVYGTMSTDANIPLSMGVCANTIGTINGSGSHTREEWVEKASLPKGLAIVLELLLSYVEG